MKKLLVALPLVAGASWAGTSYFAGVQSEVAYDQMLSQLGIMGPLLFEKESFENGLTTSTAVTAVRESHRADAPIIFKLLHTIKHSTVRIEDAGPQIASATITTTLSEESDTPNLAEFRGYFEDNDPIRIVSIAKLSGAVDSELTITPLTITTEKQLTLSIDKSTFSINSSNHKTDINGTLGAATLSGPDGITGSSSEAEISLSALIKNSIPLEYDAQWFISSVEILDARSNNGMNIQELSLSSKLITNNDFVQSSAGLEITNIDPTNPALANSFPIRSGKVDATITGLSATGIKEYINAAGQLPLRNSQSSKAGSQVNDSGSAFSPEMLSALKNLVTEDAELKYAIELKNDAGDGNIDYALRFSGDDSANGMDRVKTVADALNTVEMDIDIAVDKSALEISGMSNFMNSLPAKIAFIDNDKQWISKGSLRGTVVDINGDLYPLEKLAGEFLNMPIEAVRQIGEF